MQRRWDTDETGHGIGDAQAFTPAVHQLLDKMTANDWVTEDPEAHLLPHIERAVEGIFSLDAAAVVDHCLDVRLTWLRDEGNWRDLEFDIYRVVASFAENSTFIRKQLMAGGVEFEVTTGVMDRDGRFATHGHTVRLRVRGARIDELLRG